MGARHGVQGGLRGDSGAHALFLVLFLSLGQKKNRNEKHHEKPISRIPCAKSAVLPMAFFHLTALMTAFPIGNNTRNRAATIIPLRV
ncbi:hypothetical protein A3A67_04345 [Candidatus Peribacteria bacterium RIFCSPLOWO2_01_FULL_51_18]|nr:MAG: hypothetical protein A3C52_02315 [Candidatus Peribacteria bacterium RIFCSPHIGHO2_02_FULL_51_15]OGJ66249.1 MAG: hypothetical protein A3A67_04345 [Candidatus Peribacteria bacterium RIFCSPLOWO2_01_FULL_51_18]OGJ68406.1 MAG: hypothetical protein A3J34_01310 [Candidatus Peribacteria bacterium RIFCSPLOWO2_02_FULL_51_10]